jgi:hypothetical protein
MSKLKVTVQDVRNMQKAYAHYKIEMERLQVTEDAETAKQSKNALKSMRRTFGKIENVLLIQLREQDK